MNFTYSEEQDELRSSVRRFLEDKASSADARRVMDTDDGYDEAVWRQMAEQLGVQGLAIPEEYGGSGYGWVELGIVFEEMGRALLCAPYFSGVALAAQVLLAVGDDAAKAEYLPRIADGSLRATVAVTEADGRWGLASVEATARADSVSGVKMFVVDGAQAELLIVIARGPDGLGAYAVDGDATGVTRTSLAGLDLTRRLARVEFDGAPARRLGSAGDARAALERALDLALVALAAEQAGGAQRCLDMAVEYATIREQFGRPIGSFQAIKHKCADMMLLVESARSAAMYAAWCAAGNSDDLPLAASLAKAYCSEAYAHCAAENIQVHGGIGFTWEHDAHLHFRRAKSSQLLFGEPHRHRERIAELMGHTDTAGLTFAADDEEFRTELQAFLAEHAPGKPPKDAAGKLAHQRAWAATKFDHSFAAPAWPKDVGGMDLPFARQVIYQEEMARARVPSHPGTGVNMVGPTLIKYATPEQRERYMTPMLRGDELWAQAFSEPGAGSDLPSLRTTAVREGDEYVINGQKVWNTNADKADMFFALVRTGTQESRQNGITYLLIDAHADGVSVRPLRDLTGEEHFAEIFFDDVRVPVANRVGEENAGWAITRTTLGHERAAEALNQAAFYGGIIGQVVALANERSLADDPVLRDRVAAMFARVRIMRVNAMRTISDIFTTGEPGPASSISRLYNSTLEQDLHVLATDLLGAYGVLGRGDAYAVQKGRWVQGMLMTRASTIGAGTAEIQRNTIAEQVLGLPRDPAMPPR